LTAARRPPPTLPSQSPSRALTAADHITVTDRALAQIPDAHRYGTPI